MKKIIVAVGIVALIGMIAVPAIAHGPRWGGGGRMMGNWGGGGPGDCPFYGKGPYAQTDTLTEEQRGELKELHQKFYDETAQVRSDLRAKQGELRALMNTSNPDETKAKALQEEVSDLKAKMAEARIEYQLKARKINPDARYGLGAGKGKGGYGRHMRGYGHGPNSACPRWDQGGPGWDRGGFGPGSCRR